MTDLAFEIEKVSRFSLDMFKISVETLSYRMQRIPDEMGLLLECNCLVIFFTETTGVILSSQRPLLARSLRLTIGD